MKFLVLVFALIAQRFWPRRLPFNGWILSLVDRLPASENPGLSLGFALLLPLTSRAIVLVLLSPLLFGFFGLCLNALIVWACLQSYEGDAQHDYCLAANERWFAPLFCYLILGGLGIVLYRLLSLYQSLDRFCEPSHAVLELLDWIPIRITALLYLLVGNYQRGWPIFLENLWAKPRQNQWFLSQCATAALDQGQGLEPTTPEASTLVKHAMIVGLVVFAFWTIL